MSPPRPLPEVVAKNRFLGFLIWQSISSTAIFFSYKLIELSILPSSSFSVQSLVLSILSFTAFHFSQLILSASLAAISSPQPVPPASFLQLATSLLRLLFVSGNSSSPDLRRRAKVSLNIAAYVAAACFSGFVSAVAMCGRVVGGGEIEAIAVVGFRGSVIGLLYALHFAKNRRWLLHFPIIQRPPFFSFKMGIPAAIGRAFRLSTTGYTLASVLMLMLSFGEASLSALTTTQFLLNRCTLYLGIFCMLLCWELSHLLHQVLHTKRFVYAPPKGSAAAETNPTETLISALEETASDSLPRYLAYLDLCMVCENNVDMWRRAAFFEETGETYRKVTAVSLRPLEELASKLSEGLEGSPEDQLSKQLLSASDPQLPSRIYEPLNNFQKISWCARAISSLTAHSHKEDRYGVAQLSGSTAATLSTLLSSLLAVEAFMGKKTHLQSPHQLLGPAGIRWAALNTGKRDVPPMISKRTAGPLHSNAYAIADVLRTSIYCIVSTFYTEMVASAKAGLLEKDWIKDGKPLHGSRELLVQKLQLFLDYRA
ncbi:unnamed protein product [Linum trigynum]|uniref:Nucleoporin protein Ndc1-Nup n=1 Tax=Linum trigynum TaxID=586398 RepID=A0AAV2EJP0_9ROSI